MPRLRRMNRSLASRMESCWRRSGQLKPAMASSTLWIATPVACSGGSALERLVSAVRRSPTVLSTSQVGKAEKYSPWISRTAENSGARNSTLHHQEIPSSRTGTCSCRSGMSSTCSEPSLTRQVVLATASASTLRRGGRVGHRLFLWIAERAAIWVRLRTIRRRGRK